MKTQIERFALKHVLSRLPRQVLVRLGGGRPVTIAGRTLHPLFQAMMYVNRNRPGMEVLSPQRARAAYTQIAAMAQADDTPMARVRDDRVAVNGGHIRVRCYTPPGIGASDGAISPAIVYFHGGGHVVGDIDNYDRTVRYIAAKVGCRLVNVDYRCAPEHKFPAAAEDAIAAYEWVLANAAGLGIDSSRLAVMGDSAGGNLSAVVAMAARDRGFTAPLVQCLIYPVVDLRCVSPSIDQFASGFGLTKALIQWFGNHYVRDDADRLNVLGSPLLAESHAGLAPAIITVAGFDPLYDEGVEYARKLEAAGVPVTLLRHDDLTHAWVTMTGTVPPAQAAMDETCAQLRAALFAKSAAAKKTRA